MYHTAIANYREILGLNILYVFVCHNTAQHCHNTAQQCHNTAQQLSQHRTTNVTTPHNKYHNTAQQCHNTTQQCHNTAQQMSQHHTTNVTTPHNKCHNTAQQCHNTAQQCHNTAQQISQHRPTAVLWHFPTLAAKFKPNSDLNWLSRYSSNWTIYDSHTTVCCHYSIYCIYCIYCIYSIYSIYVRSIPEAHDAVMLARNSKPGLNVVNYITKWTG